MTQAEIAAPRQAGGILPMVADCLAYLELERGLSRNTLEAYRCDSLQFGEFLDTHDRSALACSPGDIAAFLPELAEGTEGRPPVAATTLGRKVACLRSFYRSEERRVGKECRSRW